MNPLKILKDIINGYRHRRGFGVHSPFAFTVVNEIVRDPYQYYAYEAIELKCLRSRFPRLRKRARFIHRLCARLSPSRISVSADLPEAILMGARLGASSSDGKKTSLYAAWRKMPQGFKGEAGDILVVFDPLAGLEKELERSMRFGMLMHSEECLLAIFRDTMHFKSLRMLF